MERLQKIESLLSNSLDLGYSAGCPFDSLLTLELVNGKTVTVAVANDDCDAWMSNGRFYTFYPNDGSDNDGNIGIRLFKLGTEPYIIKKGDRIGQGMFINYLVADNGNTNNIRNGGFGSTNKN